MDHRTVSSVMTPAERVISVRLDTPHKAIAKLLSENRISAVPVVDDESRVLGVVSEADLLARESWREDVRPTLLSAAGERQAHAKAAAATALDVMTAPAVTVGPDADVVRAARVMGDRRVKRLIVTDPEEHLLGVVSRQDVLRLFARSDEDIRADIARDPLLAALGADPADWDIEVDDGAVRLRGRVATRSLAEIAGLVVRRVDGVGDVVNELGYDRDDLAAATAAGHVPDQGFAS